MASYDGSGGGQAEQERVAKEREERDEVHHFRSVRVATLRDMQEHVGDSVHYDLVDWSKACPSFPATPPSPAPPRSPAWSGLIALAPPHALPTPIKQDAFQINSFVAHWR